MTDKKETQKLIRIAHESLKDSILSDVFTFAMLAALIGLGVLLDSSAMQWVGAVMAFLGVFSKAARRLPLMTLDEARHELDRIEAAREESK